MPRHPRLFIPEATYHVYCRVTRGEFVFDDPFEAAEFVLAVREGRDLRDSFHGSRPFIQKHPTSVARWISLGLHMQLEDRSFRERIDDIDRRISSSVRNNPRML